MRRAAIYFIMTIVSIAAWSGIAFGQIADTLYFDDNWNPSDSAHAEYYRT